MKAPLWSPARVAKERGVPLRTVNAACRSGRLKARRIEGADGSVSTWGVKPEDAMAWAPRRVGRPRIEDPAT
jgi:hypothetical protein